MNLPCPAGCLLERVQRPKRESNDGRFGKGRRVREPPGAGDGRDLSQVTTRSKQRPSKEAWTVGRADRGELGASGGRLGPQDGPRCG